MAGDGVKLLMYFSTLKSSNFLFTFVLALAIVGVIIYSFIKTKKLESLSLEDRQTFKIRLEITALIAAGIWAFATFFVKDIIDTFTTYKHQPVLETHSELVYRGTSKNNHAVLLKFYIKNNSNIQTKIISSPYILYAFKEKPIVDSEENSYIEAATNKLNIENNAEHT